MAVGRPRQRRHRADARGRAPHERAGVDVADLDAPARADPGQRVRRAGAPCRRHRPHGLGEDPRAGPVAGHDREHVVAAIGDPVAVGRPRRVAHRPARGDRPRHAAVRRHRAQLATAPGGHVEPARRPRRRRPRPEPQPRPVPAHDPRPLRRGDEHSPGRQRRRAMSERAGRSERHHRGHGAPTAEALPPPRPPRRRSDGRQRQRDHPPSPTPPRGAGPRADGRRPAAPTRAPRRRRIGKRSGLEAIAQRAHRSTASCSPSSPRRSRELTVPRGSPSAEAISPGVKPSRWRMTMTARWSGGSAAERGDDVVARRVGAIERRRLDARVGHLAPQLARTGVVDGAVDDDAVKPRPERPAAVEAVERADGGQERLLGHVLGRGRVVEHEPRRPVGPRPMAAEELGEGLGRAALRGAHERRLGRARPSPARGAGPQRLQGDRRHARDRRTHHTPVTSAARREVPAIMPAVQSEFLPPDPYAEAPPAPQPASRPVFLPPDAARRGHRAAPEQQGRLGADLRLGQSRPARLQRRPALLPDPSRLDRRLGPRQQGQARRPTAATRPTSRSSSPSSA